MMTQRLTDEQNQKQRAGLQAKLNNHDLIKANLDRARDRVKAVRKRVDSFELTIGALVDPENAFQAAGLAFSDLTNTIPGELVNSCRDRELRDEWEVAMSLRVAAIAELQQSREKLKRAEQDLASTKSRIAQQRGEPAILQDGDSMPWDRGVIAKTFSALQVAFGNVTTPTWAILADNSAISFGPSVRAEDAKFYSGQWFDDLKALRMAKGAHAETERRLTVAESVLADVKQRMIASAV